MVEIRDGERVSDGEISVVLLADLEEVAIADVRSRPYCDDIPPPHVHPHHADITYVVEGELELRLEDGERRIGPGTWILIPPGVAHTIVVTDAAHTLALHVPGSGYGDLVRGLHTARSDEELQAVRTAFDQQPAPERGADPGLVRIVRAGGDEGETLGGRSRDRRATLLIDTEELTLTEFEYGPGMRGADLHVHHTHADAFLVVEGRLAIRNRDGVLEAPAGTLVVFPPDVVHGFDNGAEASSRFFNLHVPSSGFGDYLRGRNPGFDQHDPPEDGDADPAAIVVVRLSE
jgi:quercetin dioxygenase-like cupin family protein